MPNDFLRGVLGVFAVGCAYMAGRTLVVFRQGRVKISALYSWILRMTVCLGAVAFRHELDLIDFVLWGMSAAAFALGFWGASHQKPPEDLTDQIFPQE